MNSSRSKEKLDQIKQNLNQISKFPNGLVPALKKE